MDADYIGTVLGLGSEVDSETRRITDVYILVGISKDMDTLEIRVSLELSHLYYVGRVVQIGIHGQYLVVIPL